MKEFFRGPVWASETIAQLWTPRFAAATALWATLERAVVEHRLRPSALISVGVSELSAVQSWVTKAGLAVTIFSGGSTRGAGCVRHVEDGSGVRIAVHAPDRTKEWRDAAESHDDGMTGELLGYPKCCQEFFLRTWGHGVIDPTRFTVGDPNGAVNPFLRWLGIRLIPHMPCSFDCAVSARMQDDARKLAHVLGLSWQLRWMEEILSFPVEYSTLHGIAIVETPAFRFCVSSDACPSVVRMSRRGTFRCEPETWEDNGFVSPAAMDVAHDVLLRTIREALATQHFHSIVDLGCGDGRLLAKVLREFCLTGIGIEADVGRIERGKRRYPAITFQQGQVEDETCNDDTALYLAMVRRMPSRAPLPKHVVLYDYDYRIGADSASHVEAGTCLGYVVTRTAHVGATVASVATRRE